MAVHVANGDLSTLLGDIFRLELEVANLHATAKPLLHELRAEKKKTRQLRAQLRDTAERLAKAEAARRVALSVELERIRAHYGELAARLSAAIPKTPAPGAADEAFLAARIQEE